MVMRQHTIPDLTRTADLLPELARRVLVGRTTRERPVRPDKTACASEPPCQRDDRAKDVPAVAVRDNGGAGRPLDRQSRARACR
jgi:hypothetical protein